MRILAIQLSVIAALLVICSTSAIRNAQAIVVPAAETESASQEVKDIETQLQKIISEMTAEQQRHQKKMENIKKDLRQLEASLSQQAAQEKPWIPAKIALFLDQDSK